MQIISARFRKNEEESIEVTPAQIKAHMYEQQYRGKLFCTTDGCDARIVYVHRTGNSSYFRTWQRDNHATHCNHYFERGFGRVGGRTDEVINVAISSEKRKKALAESYMLAKLEGKMTVVNLGGKRKTKKSETTKGKENRAQLQLVLFDGEPEDVIREKGYRAPRLFKRDVNGLRETDIGKIRVVNGIVKDVVYDVASAQIRIERDEVGANVIFGEAFFADSPNYAGLFHHVRRYISENQNVIFVGMGEVRLGSKGYELFIFNGDGFTIQNTGLLTLAQMYSSGLWG